MHKRASSHLGPEQLLYSLLGCSMGRYPAQGGLGGSFMSLQQVKYGKGFLFPLGSIKYQLSDVSLVKGLRLRVLMPPFPNRMHPVYPTVISTSVHKGEQQSQS